MKKLIIPALILVSSCSDPTTYVKKAVYQHRLKQVDIGMAKDQFLVLFPECEVKGAKDQIQVFEIKVYEYWSVPSYRPGVYRDPGGGEWESQWFYFYQGKLVQFGRPNDWPRDPDKILEIRNR